MAEQFLRALFAPALNHPDYSGAVVSLWSLPSKMSRHLPLVDLPAVAWAASELDGQGAEVYFGVTLRKPGIAPDKRGARGDLLAATALWLDIDIENGKAHAAKNLPKTQEEAIELLVELGSVPTLIINSGNGLHVYWRLDAPVSLRTPAEIDRFEGVLLGLQQRAKSLAAKRGWHLDITADATRVLRLPGTMNRKPV